jgi:Fe-S-cluster-containing hydrogenase component 2
MNKGYEATGVLSVEDLGKAPGFPSEERMKKGPVAVIECVQDIPCNPCVAACPFGAINVETLIGLPELDEEKCIGCGSCIAHCPGLAIFLVDYNHSETHALISFAYEFLPLPKVGDIVDATDRSGRVVTKGKVIRVLEKKDFDHTAVISIAVLKEYVHDVRGIAFLKGGE